MMPNRLEIQQDELLAAILDSAQDPMVSLDREGVIIGWNKAAHTVLGYSGEEALGQPATLIAPQLSPLDFDHLFQRLQAGEKIAALATHFKAKNGQVLAVALNISLLQTRTSRVLGTSIVVNLPSAKEDSGNDLVLLNAELLKSERRFSILSDTVADMLWSTDIDGGVPRHLSAKFVQYIGIAAESLTGRTWMELLHPEDREAAQAAWRNSEQTKRPFQVEFRLRRFDGVYRWFLGRGTPVLGEDGEIIQWLGTCTDTDDMKRSAEALRRSNNELKQFAYAAAHDLQEPLRNVATSVSMLRRHYGSKLDPSGMEWIDASVEGAHRLYAMVKDLLTFSTILDEEADFSRDTRVSARSAAESALIELSSEVEEAAPEIRIGELPYLGVQRTHAVRLFQNIIGNSVKYRRSDVRLVIEISAIPSGTDWTLSVKDNGIGFRSVYASKIFGVFTRLHSRDTYPGNGIGLAICERIVAHYGGRIWAEAEPGSGAAFHFTLPGVPAER